MEKSVQSSNGTLYRIQHKTPVKRSERLFKKKQRRERLRIEREVAARYTAALKKEQTRAAKRGHIDVKKFLESLQEQKPKKKQTDTVEQYLQRRKSILERNKWNFMNQTQTKKQRQNDLEKILKSIQEQKPKPKKKVTDTVEQYLERMESIQERNRRNLLEELGVCIEEVSSENEVAMSADEAPCGDSKIAPETEIKLEVEEDVPEFINIKVEPLDDESYLHLQNLAEKTKSSGNEMPALDSKTEFEADIKVEVKEECIITESVDIKDEPLDDEHDLNLENIGENTKISGSSVELTETALLKLLTDKTPNSDSGKLLATDFKLEVKEECLITENIDIKDELSDEEPNVVETIDNIQNRNQENIEETTGNDVLQQPTKPRSHLTSLKNTNLETQVEDKCYKLLSTIVNQQKRMIKALEQQNRWLRAKVKRLEEGQGKSQAKKMKMQ